MTKKEISEIRKQCNKKDYSFTKICGCYVHGKDRQTDTFSRSFYTLPEKDIHKYIDIFRKSLSGSLNKNLFNVPFGYKGDGKGIHESLDILVRTGLEDDEALELLYSAVIDSYNKVENYVILLMHNRYDVPGKASDGTTMEDASDEVYSYISCAICPVSLSKPGLAYQGREGFSSVKQDWVAGMPENAFLYPSFNGRSTDTGEALYYSSSAKHLREDFAEAVFENPLPLPAEIQKECFAGILEEIFEGSIEYGAVCEIKDCLDEIAVATEDAGGDSIGFLNEEQVRRIIEGAAGREIGDSEFETASKKVGWEKGGLYAGNLTDLKKFEIKMPEAMVRINEGMTARPEVKVVGGRNCLVIPIEGMMTVNGILARPDVVGNANGDEE